MAPHRFCHHELRTRDIPAARAFYADVLGPDFWGPDTSLSPIPERALARGVPPHWLGHLGVPDIEATARALVSMGAERLGPTFRAEDGSPYAVLRDPFGAVLALCPPSTPVRPSPVALSILHTSDHVTAFSSYSNLFGWSPRELLDLGPELGHHQSFAWDDSGEPAGSVADTARSPRVHPHWLFCFRVADIASALDRARAHNAHLLPVIERPNGDLVAGGEDPQGAAFAIHQSRRAPG